MCRLLLMTAIKDANLAEQFMREAKVPMSVGNNMGIGYSAVKSDGSFFTERWHDNEKFMDRNTVRSAEIARELEKYKLMLSSYTNLDQNYSLFGNADMSDMTTITMHTRFATCGREFMNTHPFVDGDTSLVHNGVIYNANSLKLNKISTCDSEVALQAYINNNVGKELNNAQTWLDTLSGYWAFGILSRDTSGTRILDIIRNDAWLYYSEVRGLGVVFATTQDIISSSATKLGLEFTKPEVIKDNKLFRFNAVTGDLLAQVELKDSKLNKRTSYYGYEDAYDYEAVTGKKKDKPNLTVLSNPSKIESENDESQESLPLGVRNFSNYAELFEYLYNTDEPLLDRLLEYDDAFSTNHSYQYECIPPEFRQETWKLDDFDHVLDEIDEMYCHLFDSDARGNR